MKKVKHKLKCQLKFSFVFVIDKKNASKIEMFVETTEYQNHKHVYKSLKMFKPNTTKVF